MAQLELLQAQVENIMVGMSDLHSAISRIELRQKTFETFVNRKFAKSAESQRSSNFQTILQEDQRVGKSHERTANTSQGEPAPDSSENRALVSDLSVSDIPTKASENESNVADLSSCKNQLPVSLERFENRLNSIEQKLPVFENRFSALESSDSKLQDEISVLNTEERISSVQDSLKTFRDSIFPTMENKLSRLDVSLRELCDESLQSIQKRVFNLESSKEGFQRETVLAVESRLNTSETSQNEFRETILTTVDGRLNKLEESQEDLQKQISGDTKSRLNILEGLMKKLYDQDLTAVYTRFNYFQFMLEKCQGSVVQESAIERIPEDTVFVLGGHGSQGIVETFSLSYNTWNTRENISYGPDEETLAVTVGNIIVVIEVEKKRTRTFDIVSKKWKDVKSPHEYSEGMKAAADGHFVYLTGGKFHWTRCDILDVQTHFWAKGPNMNVGRYHHGSVTLAGKIYCCGGRDGKGKWNVTSLMEVLDPRKEEDERWTFVAKMHLARSSFGLASCGCFLWAVGGWDGSSFVTELERYDPAIDTWTKMANMNVGRCNLSACFFSEKLYAVGGRGSETIKTVEMYDPEENEWKEVAPLNKARDNHSSCVVQLPSP